MAMGDDLERHNRGGKALVEPYLEVMCDKLEREGRGAIGACNVIRADAGKPQQGIYPRQTDVGRGPPWQRRVCTGDTTTASSSYN